MSPLQPGHPTLRGDTKKEKVTARIWIAIFIGFIGVLIIMRPGLTVFDSKSLIALAGAFFLGFYQIVTRNISKHDSNETSLFFSSIIGIILMGIVSIFFWKPITISFIVTVVFASFIRLLSLRLSGGLASAIGSDISCESYRRTLYQPYTKHLSRNTQKTK